MFFTTEYDSPLDKITLASDGTNLVGAWFEGQTHYAESLPHHTANDNLFVFAQTKNWLDTYFDEKEPTFKLPLNPVNCTPFRAYVWQILQQIPYGATTTYGQIAAQIQQQTGKKMSAQAVGGAVGHNPIAIIIPCHRVVGSDGSLTGYAAGLDKKKFLLSLEGIDIDALSQQNRK